MKTITQATPVTQVALPTYRFVVELASEELTYDDELNEIPTEHQIIEVTVLEPTRKAIVDLLTEKGYLYKWGLVSYWVPQKCEEF